MDSQTNAATLVAVARRARCDRLFHPASKHERGREEHDQSLIPVKKGLTPQVMGKVMGKITDGF